MMVSDHQQKYLKATRQVLSVLVYPLHLVANMPLAVSNWALETMSTRSRLQEENGRLRDLLESSLKVKDRVLIAELVAVNLDPYKQQVLINKGKKSGVFEGQPVLDANAVMGQVISVNPYTSTVLMITDARHSLPIQVLRTGLRAIAMGTGNINKLEVPHLPNNTDIQIGDLLVTSGLGGHFPPGYPVATVIDIHHAEGQPFISIQATPNAQLDHTREVLLVWTLAAPELNSTLEEPTSAHALHEGQP